MVVIRLARTGTNKRPFYHIVVTDSRKPRDGKFIERIGYFNPGAKGGDIRLKMDKERIAYWNSKGAQNSERVIRLIKDFELGLTQPKADPRNLKKAKRAAKTKAEKAAQAKAAAAPAAETPAVESTEAEKPAE